MLRGKEGEGTHLADFCPSEDRVDNVLGLFLPRGGHGCYGCVHVILQIRRLMRMKIEVWKSAWWKGLNLDGRRSQELGCEVRWLLSYRQA